MSDFYVKEAEKSEWIRDGINRERNRIIDMIEKRMDVLNNFDEFKGELPKDVWALTDLIVQHYNALKKEIKIEVEHGN